MPTNRVYPPGGEPHTHSTADVTSGTFDPARIPVLDAAKIGTGKIPASRLSFEVFGVHTRWLTGRYYGPRSLLGETGTLTTVTNNLANRALASPVWVPHDATIDRIAVEVMTPVTGATITLGLYADDGNGFPGALVASLGAVSAATSGVKEAVISQPLTGGRLYYLVTLFSHAGVAVRCYEPRMSMWGAGTPMNTSIRSTWYADLGTGTLPSTFPSGGSTIAFPILVEVRAA